MLHLLIVIAVLSAIIFFLLLASFSRGTTIEILNNFNNLSPLITILLCAALVLSVPSFFITYQKTGEILDSLAVSLSMVAILLIIKYCALAVVGFLFCRHAQQFKLSAEEQLLVDDWFNQHKIALKLLKFCRLRNKV